ncbi:hypothetical protein DCE93_02720 [Agromyces badenianii]|uniref:Fucose permease n=1 Tax=Agromyces badenianii TaxID=2080742 RepID=A0A2S0WTY3_9MICO|nr:hypothetical protein [Agromyces badenianii]AWB94704.1 hypothetical protein DCE93_02720 [Agromyces badenianii]
MTPAIRGLGAAFAGLGATAAVIPSVLPAIEQAIGASVVAAVPALFGGAFVGLLASEPGLRRLRPLHLTAIGCLLQALALAGAAFAGTATAFIVFAAIAGAGLGLTESSASVASKIASTTSTATVLTALTGTVAVAAALTPLLVAVAAGLDRPALVLSLVAAVQLVAVAGLVAGARGTPAPPPPRHPPRIRRATAIVLLPLAVALPLYVGVESVFAGWSAVIPAELLQLDAAAAALGTSVFWGLMAVGRFASAALQQYGVTPQRALLIALLSAAGLLGLAALLVPAAPGLGLAAVALAVVALAPIYALVVGVALDRLDTDDSAGAAGLLVTFGVIGGSVVPAAVLQITGDPAASGTFAVTALLCLVIAALSTLRRGITRPAGMGNRTG